MKSDDNANSGKRYPAQKNLQMKAGIGDIDVAAVSAAEEKIGSQGAVFLKIVQNLLQTLNRQIVELEDNIEQDAFISTPDRQIVVNNVIQTLMDIKSNIGYTGIKSLDELTSLVLLTLDNSCKVDMEVKTALHDFSRLLFKCTLNASPETQAASSGDIQKMMTQWSKIRTRSAAG